MKSRTQNFFQSETFWPSEDPGSHGPEGPTPGASCVPRTARERQCHQDHPVVLVDLKVWHWLDVMFPASLILFVLTISYQSDLVRVDNLAVVDMWSPDEDHVWGAMDEGCNSTCHFKACGELAGDKLKHHGLTSRWIDRSAKSFAGLGYSTTTLGKRNLPLCIQLGGDSRARTMESHEVDTDAFFAHGTVQMLHWKFRIPKG